LTPHCFSYVVPENLIQPEELPTFAGLYYIKGNAPYTASLVQEIRKPARLHDEVLPDRVEYKMAEKTMFRFWKERERLLVAHRTIEDMKAKA
jgi:hypothetical protein